MVLSTYTPGFDGAKNSVSTGVGNNVLAGRNCSITDSYDFIKGQDEQRPQGPNKEGNGDYNANELSLR